jgi:predicted CopG family antitoxin
MNAKTINNMDTHRDNSDKMDKVKIQLDKDVVNRLIQLKVVGDTYSDVVRRLLDDRKTI